MLTEHYKGEGNLPSPKIDHRHTYIVVCDTETANTLTDSKGKPDMSCVLPYDCGWIVADTHGGIYQKRSFINRDIFENEEALMKSAYYANKIPRYKEDISSGKRIVSDTYSIRSAMLNDIATYNCIAFVAHNARFDYNALNNSQRWNTKSKYRYWLPYEIEIWDTMKMAQDVILQMPTYLKFCEKNGYTTPKGKPKKTAEALYRFISGNNEFSESHTGLEDVEIEYQIFLYCMRQHKKMRKLLFEDSRDAPPPSPLQQQIMKVVRENAAAL